MREMKIQYLRLLRDLDDKTVKNENFREIPAKENARPKKNCARVQIKRDKFDINRERQKRESERKIILIKLHVETITF